MARMARLLGFAVFLALGMGLGVSSARAQGWDYGRQMFGFAQYYPGSGWSSYYHPNFDPDAFFPTTFGLRTNGRATAYYAGPRAVVVPHRHAPYRHVPTPPRGRFLGRRWFNGPRSPTAPVRIMP